MYIPEMMTNTPQPMLKILKTEWLGDFMEAGRPVLRGLEVILQILRLGGHFCGDHGASAPPPSLEMLSHLN